MKGAIILNGISRKKKKFYSEFLPLLSSQFSIAVFETEYSGHARSLAALLVRQRFDFILAAGGDGTLNQTLNGMMDAGGDIPLPSLGLIPMGTGNDFARSCNIRFDVAGTIRLLRTKPKATDIARLTSCDRDGTELKRFFLNCCSLGMGPDVVTLLQNNAQSPRGGHSYMHAIVKTFFTQRPPVVRCESGTWKFEGKVRVLGIANGISFGRAVYLAPDARLDDGRFNIFIALDVPTYKFLLYLHLLKLKWKLNNKSTVYRLADVVSIVSDEKVALETEGELAGYLPAHAEIIPGKINFFR